jgi:hypothetical protein
VPGAYRWLCRISGGVVLAGGLGLGALFCAYHAPGGVELAVRLGPNGAYFAGFAGTGLLAWGGALLAAARTPALARGVGTASAFALAAAALQRMLAWLLGDYAALGELPRVEAALFLVWALAFVWLRPPRAAGAA